MVDTPLQFGKSLISKISSWKLHDAKLARGKLNQKNGLLKTISVKTVQASLGIDLHKRVGIKFATVWLHDKNVPGGREVRHLDIWKSGASSYTTP